MLLSNFIPFRAMPYVAVSMDSNISGTFHELSGWVTIQSIEMRLSYRHPSIPIGASWETHILGVMPLSHSMKKLG